MEKFNRALRGYDPEEVNAYLDGVIAKVEKMVGELKEKQKEVITKQKEIDEKNQMIAHLSKVQKENVELKAKLAQYQRTEETFNRAILMAQKTSDQMRMAAHNESEVILEDAKKNANRIVNEALLKAEKTTEEADRLRRNVTIYKRRLTNIVESQLEVIKDIEVVDL